MATPFEIGAAPAPSGGLADLAIQAAPGAPATADPLAQAPVEAAMPLPDNPVVQAVSAGVVPAVSGPAAGGNPILDEIANANEALIASGLDLYQSVDGQTAVLFNPKMVSGDEIAAADQSGQLAAVAVPFEQVVLGMTGQEMPAASTGKPVAQPPPIKGTPEGFVSPGAATRGPGRVTQSLMKQRLKNLSGGPESGPSPGAGRIVNGIERGAV